MQLLELVFTVLKAGGVLAFAVLVLVILWQLKPLLTGLLEAITSMKVLLASLLERERARAERIAANDAARLQAAEATEAAAAEFGWAAGAPTHNMDEEDTNPIALPVKPRAKTDPLGRAAGGYSSRRAKRDG